MRRERSAQTSLPPRGCRTHAEPDGSGFRICITKQAGSSTAPERREGGGEIAPAADGSAIVYLFGADHIGSNRDLGKVLTNGFLNAALALPYTQCTIILISNGVRLATNGSYALDVLKKIAAQGHRILICGTCLDFFKIRDDVDIGTISNAFEIMQAMTAADKVVGF